MPNSMKVSIKDDLDVNFNTVEVSGRADNDSTHSTESFGFHQNDCDPEVQIMLSKVAPTFTRGHTHIGQMSLLNFKIRLYYIQY